jgi:hypothetical protein
MNMETVAALSAEPGRTSKTAPVTLQFLRKNNAKFYEMTPPGLACVSKQLAVLRGKLYCVTGELEGQTVQPVLDYKAAVSTLKDLLEISAARQKLEDTPALSETKLKGCNRYGLSDQIICSTREAFVDRLSSEIFFYENAMGIAHWHRLQPTA